MSVRITKATALLLGAAVVAGCGSSGGGSSSLAQSISTPTKSKFLREADAICTATDIDQTDALKKYVEKHPAAKTQQAAEKQFVLKVALPMVQTEAEEVGALVTPKGDAREVQGVVNALETAVEEAVGEPERLLEGPSESPFTGVEELARAYGFKACSEPL